MIVTREELINVFKYIVKKCDMLINNGNYEADAYTQDTVEDIAELCNHILDGDYGKLIEVKEVDLKQKSFVKIDRKVLFEICDAILNHDGYSDVNDCLENDSECFWGKWDEGFRKKVENIRRNS